MVRVRLAKRNAMIGAPAVILLACCAATAFLRGPDDPALVHRRPPKASIAWHVPARGIRSLGFSASGRYVWLIGSDGRLSVYDESGARRYCVAAPDADRAVISPDGSYTMSYTQINPSRHKLVFLDGIGRVYWTVEVAGAVWSADACCCGGGARFVVGTGQGYVYCIDIGGNRKRYRRWREPGAVVSIGIDKMGEAVTLGTWQESMVARSSVKGKPVWEVEGGRAALQMIDLPVLGERVLVRSVPNNAALDGELTVLDGEGSRVWRQAMAAGQSTRVVSAPDAMHVCVGFSRVIRHKGKSMRESRAALYDSNGVRLWEKGSVFFQASPILVTSDGGAILYDGKRSLFVVSRSGEVEPSVKLAAPILRSVGSRDASKALLQCSDGMLYMIRVPATVPQRSSDRARVNAVAASTRLG